MKEERVGVGEAKTHLSELLERVRGESLVVTITRHGHPVARLVPIGLVPAAGHLAEAKGWLEPGDPFFSAVGTIVRKRTRHRPRTVRFED